MLVLLPPSEGKAAPAAGAPVDLEALAFAAELTERRLKLLGALEALGRAPRKRAVAMLGLSPGQTGEPPADPEAAATIAESAGFRVELSPDHLDVIVD